MIGNERHYILQLLWHFAGITFILETGSVIWWNNFAFWNPQLQAGPRFLDGWIFMLIIAASYAASLWGSKKILSLPRCGRLVGVLFSTSCSFALSALTLFLGARLYYSRPFLAWSFFVSIVWIYLGHRFFFSFGHTVYGFIPGAAIRELKEEWRPNFVTLESVDSQVPYDVLVVSPDMHALPPEWIRYVANRTIQGIPVLHPALLYEFFTGRLPIEYMTDGPGFIFNPPLLYLPVKRFLDWTILLLVLVPALTGISLIAVLSLFCTGRPIFFSQRRLGKNGVPFCMYKFRTMTQEGEITPLGRILRKYRLDELPQIWNVLRGEMSFIGPRPEVLDLAEQYAEEILFYNYRTSLLPGITGWAQVNYGYASVTSENRIKLGYDLYYIKNASIALDALILLKTIRTMLTGFGAR